MKFVTFEREVGRVEVRINPAMVSVLIAEEEHTTDVYTLEGPTPVRVIGGIGHVAMALETAAEAVR